ncbi:uncharacterized protein LAESUDRAFT_718610, partial [Laetiporus sulphureus 93-53]
MSSSRSSSPALDTLMCSVATAPAASATDAPLTTELFLPQPSPRSLPSPSMVVPPPSPVIEKSTPWATYTSPGEELTIEGHESLCTSFLGHLQSPALMPAQCHKLEVGLDVMRRAHDVPKDGALPVTWDSLDFFAFATMAVPADTPPASKAKPALVSKARLKVFVILDDPRLKAKGKVCARSPTPLPPSPSPSIPSNENYISSESEAMVALATPKAPSPPRHSTKSAALKRIRVESSEGESKPDSPSDIEMVKSKPAVAVVATASSAKDPSVNPPFSIQNPAHPPMYAVLAWSHLGSLTHYRSVASCPQCFHCFKQGIPNFCFLMENKLQCLKCQRI